MRNLQNPNLKLSQIVVVWPCGTIAVADKLPHDKPSGNASLWWFIGGTSDARKFVANTAAPGLDAIVRRLSKRSDIFPVNPLNYVGVWKS